jgi:hypothetical protein
LVPTSAFDGSNLAENLSRAVTIGGFIAALERGKTLFPVSVVGTEKCPAKEMHIGAEVLEGLAVRRQTEVDEVDGAVSMEDQIRCGQVTVTDAMLMEVSYRLPDSSKVAASKSGANVREEFFESITRNVLHDDGRFLRVDVEHNGGADTRAAGGVQKAGFMDCSLTAKRLVE